MLVRSSGSRRGPHTMQHTERVAFLASTELLAQVPASCLGVIAQGMQLCKLEAGQVLFEEGSVGDEAYLVVDGELGLISGGVELVRRGPGTVVGEFALIDAEPRSAGAIARGPLTLLCWPREAFRNALSIDPMVAQGILRVLTGKLRGDVERRVGLLLEQLRWRESLDRSREIQMGMLPKGTVRTAAMEVAGRCVPAGHVGGDFYDVLPFADGEVGVMILDVTGHGFYSGLFVAMAKSGLHAQAGVDRHPAPVMHAMRRTLSLSLQDMLMSCVYILAEPRRSVLRYANAGHPHPLLYRRADGVVHALEVLDPILGAQEVEEGSFCDREVPWEPGDLLVLYSDGVTEARDPDDRLFGRDRLSTVLQQVVGEVGDLSADSVCTALLDAVDEHTGGARPEDDVTLVVMRALGSDWVPA